VNGKKEFLKRVDRVQSIWNDFADHSLSHFTGTR